MKGIIMFNNKNENGKTIALALLVSVLSSLSLVVGATLVGLLAQRIRNKKREKLEKERAIDINDVVL